MKRKRVIVNKSSKVKRQRDPIPWRYCVLTVLCGLLLVSGFFVAARQHFSSVDYAMRNADLRTRIAKLQDEKRKLVILRERASSPSKIAKLAKDLGFSTMPRITVATTAVERIPVTGNGNPTLSYASTQVKSKNADHESGAKSKSSDGVPVKTATASTVDKDQIAALRGTE